MKLFAALVAWASIAVAPSISQYTRDVSVQVQPGRPGYGQGYGYGNGGGRDEQINVRCDCDDDNYRRRGNRYGPTGFGNTYGNYNGYRQGAGYNQGYTGYNPNTSNQRQTQPGGIIIVGSGRTPYGK